MLSPTPRTARMVAPTPSLATLRAAFAMSVGSSMTLLDRALRAGRLPASDTRTLGSRADERVGDAHENLTGRHAGRGHVLDEHSLGPAHEYLLHHNPFRMAASCRIVEGADWLYEAADTRTEALHGISTRAQRQPKHRPT